MVKHYIIIAHRFPNHLKRMINFLNDENSYFHIHIDAKSNISEFENIVNGDNIFFIKDRVDVKWGHYSQVQATLKIISHIVDNQNFDEGRLVFLSGQDYPIKSKDYINKFFEKYKNTDFISFETTVESLKIIQDRKDSVALSKSSKRGDFYIQKRNFIGSMKMLKAIALGRINWGLLKHFRHFFFQPPFGMNLYHGSQWWALEYSSVKEILCFYRKHKRKLDTYFKGFLCSDETFFQTLYAYLVCNGKIKNVLKGSVTYTNWKRREGDDVPITFGKEKYFEKDIEELLNVGETGLFARKFEENSKILDFIDNEVGRQ